MSIKHSQFLLVIAVFLVFFLKNSMAAAPVPDQKFDWHMQSCFRAFYFNDQRIQWSGQEAGFGVEATIGFEVFQSLSKGKMKLAGELNLNQPYEKNILLDSYRIRYLANFQLDVLEINQLYLQFNLGKFLIKAGKFKTNFGRHEMVHISNQWLNYPFIRNECIIPYETGVQISWQHGWLALDLAVTNGGVNMDTNSSKAGIVRVSLGNKQFGVGSSIKAQDGTGSEQQKLYKNHIGADCFFKSGILSVFAEIIYDQYGFHKEFEDNEIFWPRSYYYRELFYQYKTPIDGLGGYIQVVLRPQLWYLGFNYGEFYPKKIGHPFHDTITRRFVGTAAWEFLDSTMVYLIGLFENYHPREAVFSGADDYGLMCGVQYQWQR